MNVSHLQSTHSSRLNGMCAGNIPLHLLHGNEVFRQMKQAGCNHPWDCQEHVMDGFCLGGLIAKMRPSFVAIDFAICSTSHLNERGRELSGVTLLRNNFHKVIVVCVFTRHPDCFSCMGIQDRERDRISFLINLLAF